MMGFYKTNTPTPVSRLPRNVKTRDALEALMAHLKVRAQVIPEQPVGPWGCLPKHVKIFPDKEEPSR